MVSDKAFKKTEGMLYRYYDNIRLRDRLKFKSERLEIRRQQINKALRETAVYSNDLGVSAINYSKDKVMSSPTGEGPAERGMIREIEKLERELEETIRKNIKIEAKIRELDVAIADIEYILNKLNEEGKQYVEYKYSEEYNYEKIATKLPMSAATARRRRKEIVECVAKWMIIC